MVSIKDTARTIEKTYYILSALNVYCNNFMEIEEIMPVKFTLDYLRKDLDSIYAKIINEQII